MDDRYALRFESGERQGDTVPIGAGGLSIGRKPGCTLQILDGSVSGRHAELAVDAEGVLVRDLGSTNGTRVGGQRVLEARLAPGDVLHVGNVRLTFLDRAAPSAAGRAPAPAAEPVASVSAERLARSRRRSLAGGIALLVLALGGGATWFLLRSKDERRSRPRPAPAVAGNLLARGYSFEGDEDAWSSDERAPASFFKRPGANVSGEAGLEADVAPGEWAEHRSQEVAAPAGRRLVLRAQARVAGGASGRFGVELQGPPAAEGAGTCGPATAWGAIAAADGWQAVELAADVPPGFERARALLRADGLDADGSVAFDDVSLVADPGAGAPAAEILEAELWLLGAPPSEALMRRVDRVLVSGLAAFVAVPRAEGEAAGARRAAELRAAAGPTGVTLDLERLPAEPCVLALRAEPALCAAGIGTQGEGGYRAHAASFERDGVRSLLLGGGRDLVRLVFDAPVSARGAGHDGGARVEVELGAARSVGIQLDFRAEQRRAEDLAHEARKAEAAGVLGGALRLWAELLDGFPFVAELVAEADQARGRLIRQGMLEVRDVRDEVERARFFELADLFRQCRGRAAAIAQRYAPSEVEGAAGELAAEIDAELAKLELDRDADEARRLAAIADALAASGSQKLAAHVRAYAAERFGSEQPGKER